MKVKVSELTRDALNWAVAKAEGHVSRCAWMLEKDGYIAWQNYEQAWGNPIPGYSTDWSVGGLILEAHPINLIQQTLAYQLENGDYGTKHLGWAAYMTPRHSWLPRIVFKGETKLVAIMLCYVASKFGDTIEIPDGLVTTPE